MTLDEMVALFGDDSEFEGEFLKFLRIENPRHPCPDICAMIMLAELAPSFPPNPLYQDQRNDMVGSAEHDEIWLDADPETVAEKITKDQVRDLIRFWGAGECGGPISERKL